MTGPEDLQCVGPGSPEVGSLGLLLDKQGLFSTLFLSSPPESVDNCPSNCYGNGDCISGTCHCFLGFLGPDCGRGETCASTCDPYSPGPGGGLTSYFSEQAQDPGPPPASHEKGPPDPFLGSPEGRGESDGRAVAASVPLCPRV